MVPASGREIAVDRVAHPVDHHRISMTVAADRMLCLDRAMATSAMTAVAIAGDRVDRSLAAHRPMVHRRADHRMKAAKVRRRESRQNRWKRFREVL